jgi:hypothetical protein
MPLRQTEEGLMRSSKNNASATSIARVCLWTMLVSLWLTTAAVKVADAQTPPSLTAEEKLEQDFTDPLTTLPQLLVRDSYSPATYGTHVQTNQVIIRPIIPRIPNFTLLPFVQLVRPTFAVVTVPSPRGGSRTEFGDMQLFDIAILPWPRRESGWLIGIGPTFVFPTATSKSAGQGAWQAGPAFGLIYKGIRGLLIGFIVQNPVSFAYTSPERMPVNTLEIQPVIALHLYGKWYLRSAEANWMIGWRRHSPTTLPLSIGIGRTFVRLGLPPMSFFVTGQWTAYRQFAPVTAQTTINFGLTMAFPELRDLL